MVGIKILTVKSHTFSDGTPAIQLKDNGVPLKEAKSFSLQNV
jgi:hypothetical protein